MRVAYKYLYSDFTVARTQANYHATALKHFLDIHYRQRLADKGYEVSVDGQRVRLHKSGLVDLYVSILVKNVQRRGLTYYKLHIYFRSSKQWKPKDTENPSHYWEQVCPTLLDAADEALASATSIEWSELLIEAAREEMARVYPDQDVEGLRFIIDSKWTDTPGGIVMELDRRLTIEQVEDLIALVRRWDSGKA